MKKLLLSLLVLLVFLTKSMAVGRTWIGAGAGGAGTDFNSAANWSPAGIPSSSDNLTIAFTSTATIALSANATINNLTLSVAGNNRVAILDIKGFNLTVNGTSSIEALSGNGSTYLKIGVNNTTNVGVLEMKGNVTIGSTNLNGPSPTFIGNSNSKMIFRGNLTMGPEFYTSSSFTPGIMEFDGTGTQTITWNDVNWTSNFNNVNIGNINSPTVVVSTGTITPDNILGNLTVNGNSVLDLNTSFWNRSTAGGTFAMNGNSKLQLGNNTGGQTGSNYPNNFSTLSISAASTTEYYGTMAQTIYDLPSPGYGNLTLTNASTKTAGGALDIRGAFLINTGSIFSAGAGLAHNVRGNWSNSGSFTPSTSTINFVGSTQQTIQGSASTTFYNLVFNNTANNAGGDILLNGVDAIVSNSCTFTDGVVNSLTSNMLIFNDNATASGASNASFVNVKVRKIGNDAFTFPVGKLSVGYMKCGISAPSLVTDAFTAEYRRNSATALGPITAGGLARVSGCEYWTIDRTTGTSNVNVTLSWNGFSPCSAGAYVTLLSSLQVVHFNGTSWNAYGNSSYTGTGVSGTVTWNSVSSFSPFTLGSNSATTNPLPVHFSTVKAYKVSGGNQVEWTNLTEEDLIGYEVEQSTNGNNFHSIHSVSPRSNDGQAQQYSVTDVNSNGITSYYRIKALQNDGSSIYSAIVKVSADNTGTISTVIYPNPVTNGQFTVQLNNYSRGNYVLRLINANGQQVLTKNIQHAGGSLSIGINRPSSVGPGLYILQLIGDAVNVSQKLVVQ